MKQDKVQILIVQLNKPITYFSFAILGKFLAILGEHEKGHI